ncbi:MAG: low affinity iron permease family protein [Candidatus Sericytochromatia bacterium]|nr:low affinity iron permease family protein [Candidatus Sericytochromatia bacterium]
MDKISALFHRFATRTADALGSPWAFIVALAVIATWIITGPLFNYSDTWQLVINTATTIVTFLMVFLIQNTQNRDARATHLKLDELIRVTVEARNSLVNLEEDGSDKEMKDLQAEFRQLRQADAEAAASQQPKTP